MLFDLLKHDVSVHTYMPGAADDYGNPEPTYTPALDAVDPPTVKAYMQHVSQTDRRGESDDRAVDRWVCFFLPSVAIGDHDVVVWEGRQYLVESVVEAWAPGKKHHLEVALKAVG